MGGESSSSGWDKTPASLPSPPPQVRGHTALTWTSPVSPHTEDNEELQVRREGEPMENSEDPEPDRKKSGNTCDNDMHCNDDGHSSSNPDSRDSDDSFEHSDFENPGRPRTAAGAASRAGPDADQGGAAATWRASRTCGCRTASLLSSDSAKGLGQRG